MVEFREHSKLESCNGFFVFDNSRNHDAFAKNALVASKMRKGVGGKGDKTGAGATATWTTPVFRKTSFKHAITNKDHLFASCTFEEEDFLLVPVREGKSIGGGKTTSKAHQPDLSNPIGANSELLGVVKGQVFIPPPVLNQLIQQCCICHHFHMLIILGADVSGKGVGVCNWCLLEEGLCEKNQQKAKGSAEDFARRSHR